MPNTKPPYFLGIDVGTQGLRSGIFDARGNVVALSFYSYPEHHPRPGCTGRSATGRDCRLEREC